VARREGPIKALADEISGTAIVADVTSDEHVTALTGALDRVDVHRTLRGELLGKPVRLTEIAPGMVKTDFSLRRFSGDEERAAKVYEGVTPLVAEDVAEVIGFVASRPSHVNLDMIVIRPRDQASSSRFNRRLNK
jgi:NADP-dependent 3-hydroxy acid dehydrogenase YdfG